MLVAVTDDGAIGAAGCLRVDGHVTLNYVVPAHRFEGLSEAMLAALEQRAAARG